MSPLIWTAILLAYGIIGMRIVLRIKAADDRKERDR